MRGMKIEGKNLTYSYTFQQLSEYNTLTNIKNKNGRKVYIYQQNQKMRNIKLSVQINIPYLVI